MKNDWKIGDVVLCVKSNSTKNVIAGQEYTIDGFACCPDCGCPRLYLKGFDSIVDSRCRPKGRGGCGHHEYKTRIRLSKSLFIKLDLASLTNYHSQVSVKELAVPKELTELKNLQNQ